MPRLRFGTTRIVFILGSLALKLPRSRRGCRSNAHEARIYREASDANRSLLCPVVAVVPFGLLLIMQAAEPISDAEYHQLIERDAIPEWDYEPSTFGAPFEYKAADWGRIGGRLVAVDYAVECL